MDRTLLLEIIGLLFEISHKLMTLQEIPQDYGADVSLTRAEIHTVAAVGRNRNQSVTELAKELSITKGAVSQMLGRLETKGLIVKNVDPDNSSRLQISLTSTGKTAHDGHERNHEVILDRVSEHLGDLDSKTLELLHSLLARIDQMLTHFIQEAGN